MVRVWGGAFGLFDQWQMRGVFENNSFCVINFGAGTVITHFSFTVKWSIISMFEYVLYRIKMLIKVLVYQIFMFVTFQFSSIF